MKIVVLLTFCLIVVSSTAQDVEGKWMMTKEGDTYIIPENLVLEISSDTLKFFSFDTLKSTIPIKIEKDKIISEKQVSFIEVINENRFKIKSQGTVNNIDGLISTEYVRLIPTKTNLSSEEIQKLSFQFNWRDDMFTVIFNKELGDPQPLKNIGLSELIKMNLEKIDLTYFISIYESGTRKTVFPIKEVSKDRMILYGTPDEPYEIVGEKVE